MTNQTYVEEMKDTSIYIHVYMYYV